MIVRSLKAKMVVAVLLLTAGILLTMAALTRWYFEDQLRGLIAEEWSAVLSPARDRSEPFAHGDRSITGAASGARAALDGGRTGIRPMLRTARRFFFFMLAAALMVSMATAWLAMNRLISPLRAFARHVRTLPSRRGNDRLIALEGDDEIGLLARSFNHMVRELDSNHDALRRSEERYRTFVESSPDGVYFADRDGIFREINPAGARLLGHDDPSEVIGRPAVDYWADPADRERFVDELSRQKSVKSYVMHARRRDGTPIRVEITSRIIEDENGVYRGVEGILRDVTDRIKASQELERKNRELESAYREISGSKEVLQRLFEQVERAKKEWELSMDAAGNPIILVDDEGRIKRCNRALQALVGESYDRILGRTWVELFAEIGLVNDGMTGYDESVELACSRLGRKFLLNSYPYRDDKLHASGHILTLHDVTEIRTIGAALERKHEELARAYEELKLAQSTILQQEKMASIGQLAAGVAHEINNPMGFIISNLNTLRKYTEKLGRYLAAQDRAIGDLARGAAPEAVLEELGGARKTLKVDYVAGDINNLVTESLEGAERVRRIVQDLKSFSRLDEAEVKPADLNACLDSAVNILWNELKYKATVRKDYGEIPPTLCNAGQLNQVFMNLLVNAGQAIEKQGEIAIRTRAENGTILVSVADTGVGIPREKIGRVFDPFFTTKEVGKGTGLGLSITYDIVKKHNGEIAVESEPGRGTTFFVRIPVVRDSEPSLAPEAGRD